MVFLPGNTAAPSPFLTDRDNGETPSQASFLPFIYKERLAFPGQTPWLSKWPCFLAHGANHISEKPKREEWPLEWLLS